jgi:hypothetical protein
MDEVLSLEARTRFFLATDDAAVRAKVAARYPNRVLYLEQPVLNRNHPQSIEGALADLLLLARCPRLIGTYLSTFTEVAWWLSGCQAAVTIVKPS